MVHRVWFRSSIWLQVIEKCFADLSSLTMAFVLSFQSSITQFGVKCFKDNNRKKNYSIYWLFGYNNSEKNILAPATATGNFNLNVIKTDLAFRLHCTEKSCANYAESILNNRCLFSIRRSITESKCCPDSDNNQSINQSKHISIAPYVASESEAHKSVTFYSS